jgi:hypothetical protein
MDLAIVRYLRTRSAKAVYSGLKPACEMPGGNCSPSRATCAFASTYHTLKGSGRSTKRGRLL